MEALPSAPALFTAFGGAAAAYFNPAVPRWLPYGLGIGGAVSLLAIAAKARKGHAEDQKKTAPQPPNWILSPLHTLHAELTDELGVGMHDGALRITLHRVDWKCDEGKQLEQVVDYVGAEPDPAKSRGRRFPLRAGVIGTCAKDGKLMVAYRKSKEIQAFRKEMVDKWHYRPDEAKSLTEDRWSYLAHPVLVAGTSQAGAVLYMDTAMERAFERKAVRQVSERWCKGFAKYMRTQQGD